MSRVITNDNLIYPFFYTPSSIPFLRCSRESLDCARGFPFFSLLSRSPRLYEHGIPLYIVRRGPEQIGWGSLSWIGQPSCLISISIPFFSSMPYPPLLQPSSVLLPGAVSLFFCLYTQLRSSDSFCARVLLSLLCHIYRLHRGSSALKVYLSFQSTLIELKGTGWQLVCDAIMPSFFLSQRGYENGLFIYPCLFLSCTVYWLGCVCVFCVCLL